MIRKIQAVAALAVIFCAAGWAQQAAMVGTWKMNLTKSQYGSFPLPKSQTRTVVAQGKGVKITFEGVAADGSKISYSYVTLFDGADSPVAGVGQPNGGDTISSKSVDSHTTSSTWKKAGKVVATTTATVSKDGKTTTIENNGVDVNGKPRHVISVYEKQ